MRRPRSNLGKEVKISRLYLILIIQYITPYYSYFLGLGRLCPLILIPWVRSPFHFEAHVERVHVGEQPLGRLSLGVPASPTRQLRNHQRLKKLCPRELRLCLVPVELNSTISLLGSDSKKNLLQRRPQVNNHQLRRVQPNK